MSVCCLMVSQSFRNPDSLAKVLYKHRSFFFLKYFMPFFSRYFAKFEGKRGRENVRIKADGQTDHITSAIKVIRHEIEKRLSIDPPK